MRKLVAILAAGVIVAIGISVAWRFLVVEPEVDFDPKSVSIEVHNGCRVPHVARAVADELLRRGFDVYGTGNSDSVHATTTVVDLLDPDATNARAIAEALSVRKRFLFVPLRERLMPAVAVVLDSAAYLHARVIVGADYRQYFPNVVPLQ